MSDDQDHILKWVKLQAWLNDHHQAGHLTCKATLTSSDNRGRTLISNQDIEDASPILSISHSALLNPRTLPSSFLVAHCQSLSSTQILTLYLSHHRSCQRTEAKTKLESAFDPYLATFPTKFSGIPLVWLLESTFQDLQSIHGTDHLALNQLKTHHSIRHHSSFGLNSHTFKLLSHSTALKSDQVSRRFMADWEGLLKSLHHVDFHEICLSDLLWAWLVVNTRCVWYNLGCKNHDDNISLVPAVDMANHNPHSQVTLIATPHTFTMYSSYPRGTFASPKTHTIMSSSKPETNSNDKISIYSGQEIMFSYGPHGNSTLLAEYGFIADSNPWDSIDLTDAIQSHFEISQDDANEKKLMLQSAGYWGDYTIQCSSLEISHRIFIALRLLHLPLNQAQCWLDHVKGKTDDLGIEVEKRVKNSLQKLFTKVKEDLETTLGHFERHDPVSCKISSYSLQSLKTIARTELKTIHSLLNKFVNNDSINQVA
ncbi:hypothetical protein O181_055537 [Austropuccinia psidii MF-1]|uniref:SET domain-containing protein n=1 Tax=Austropuccinia psidii MF-1 TaxID=1389203 RepID=A0A9Q3EDW0_9BASI|nr:hypothetical protein [Austropuccinia psidii MF-1]